MIKEIYGELVLSFDDKKTAKVVLNSVTPDNLKVPPYIRIEARQLKNKIIFNIHVYEKGIGPLINTFNDLIRCIQAVIDTIDLIN